MIWARDCNTVSCIIGYPDFATSRTVWYASWNGWFILAFGSSVFKIYNVTDNDGGVEFGRTMWEIGRQTY